MQLITEASAEKLRGGFYTPEAIAAFIIRWGVNGSSDFDILEPSCGDGVFLEQLQKSKARFNSLAAVELDETEAEKASRIPLPNATFVNDDFHAFCNQTKQRFDLAIGNPPYIRYQYFDPRMQVEAEDIFIKAGLTYSRLTNAWVSFIVGASLLLKDQGKIGFVVPAEILQVSYAKQLRSFLAHVFNKINIISFEELVFPNIQQEVVLLLCEKNGASAHRIEHLELKNAADLERVDMDRLKSPQKTLDFKSSKWTCYFLEQAEIDFLENVAKTKRLPTLGKFADVEVGITTGSNDFFTVPLSVVEEYRMDEFARPLVGRSVQVQGAVFSENDWQSNRAAQAKAHLLVFPGRKNINGAERYIALGEQMGIHKGYKCGVREDWFVVPSLKLSQVLFLRRNHLFPKMIVNQANAYTTDTMHRVFPKPGANVQALVASFYNSLSFAFAEINGRSYGGGVLELMPGEVEKILLPYHAENEAFLPELDKMLRQNLPVESLLKISNQILLRERFGFSEKEIRLAHSIWKKLSARRLNRGKKK